MRTIDADILKVVLEKNFGHTGGASVLEQLIDEQPTVQPNLQPTCNQLATDTISRKAAIDAIYHHFPSVSRTRARTMLHEVPSARPEPQWIPCSKGLPETDDKILCQTVTKKGVVGMVIGYYFDNRWCCGMNSNVIAWMPLPEPYKEGDSE